MPLSVKFIFVQQRRGDFSHRDIEVHLDFTLHMLYSTALKRQK